MVMKISRGEIWQVNLDPTKGAEMKKDRPCLVVSVDTIGSLPLKAIVPITGWQPKFKTNPWHIKLDPDKRNGLTKASSIDCLQIRCISEDRFIWRYGQVDGEVLADVIAGIGIVIGI